MTANQEQTHEVVIEINGLTKDYQTGFVKKRNVRALDNLSLEVRRGEIFGFLGPNGAGKTTTLKLLMKLIFPTSGTARILSSPLDDLAVRSRIGYLPENPYFYDYLSGRELLEYTARLFGIPKDSAKQKAKEMIHLVGLDEDRANRQLRKYSKGMLQRIGIAQALVNDPEVVFMDEPMSGLDPLGRREVRDLLLSLREQNKTVFFSSHILSDVEAICDRAAILSRGKLVRCGDLQEMTGNHESVLEVIAVGVDHGEMDEASKSLTSVRSLIASPNGIHLLLDDDTEIDRVIALIRQSGGKLVSINPRRQTLEDIFSDAEQEVQQ
ncbi:MAG: ABC transporter ATP-binding protein [Blastocatellia bacterium]|nr:ABC transporter ATP-binding protein [Blastocatellia bacterium]